MGVSPKHLYRLVRQGTVWKEVGPTAKQFYFQHGDPAQQRRLAEAFAKGSPRQP
jgi:hypothetical protein